jgi:hypothetical protein
MPLIVGSEVFAGGCCPGAVAAPPLADGVLAIKASAAKSRMT